MSVLTALASLNAAHAGGLGLFGTAGGHTEPHWYYSSAALGPSGSVLMTEAAGTQPLQLDDPDEYEQFELNQFLANYGGGAELILGDRDSKISGGFRFFFLGDAPQKAAKDSASVTIPTATIVEAPREEIKPLGMGMVALNFGVVGDPGGLLFGGTVHAGSGFLTTDHTEFLMLEAGPHLTYGVTPELRLAGDLVYTMRFRKGYSHGANAYVGAVWLFD